jgi:hypothetical protein
LLSLTRLHWNLELKHMYGIACDVVLDSLNNQPGLKVNKGSI